MSTLHRSKQPAENPPGGIISFELVQQARHTIKISLEDLISRMCQEEPDEAVHITATAAKYSHDPQQLLRVLEDEVTEALSYMTNGHTVRSVDHEYLAGFTLPDQVHVRLDAAPPPSERGGPVIQLAPKVAQVALWLISAGGKGITVTRQDLEAFAASAGVARSTVDRRIRALRRYGWHIHSRRHDPRLPSGCYKVIATGLA